MRDMKMGEQHVPGALKALFAAALAAACLHAETGYDAWLRYQPAESAALVRSRAALPAVVLTAPMIRPTT